MKKALLLCALGTAFLAAQAAHADNFTLTFSGSSSTDSLSGDITFDASATGGAITNPGGGVTIDGINYLVVGLSNYSGADNLLDFDSGTDAYSFDDKGLSLDLITFLQTGELNLYMTHNGTDKGAYDTFFLGFLPDGDGTVKLSSESITDNSLAATPEPGSLALLGTSVLGAAGLLRRRLLA
jgi:hypothetical protein